MELGPYFVWDAYDGDAAWRPFTDLLDPDVAAERVGESRRALIGMFGLADDVVPERVVASVLFLGVASRLVSPLLADVVLHDRVRAAGPADLWWKPVPGGPWPVACGPVAARPADALLPVALRLVAPALATFRERFRLSPKVLWGNVASALAGAAGQLDRQLAGDPWPVVAGLLARPPLLGTASLSGRSLRRHNCCLYYRIPGGGTCGDCVLTSRRSQDLRPG
ncbi:(2Fe-2S)-binding protein [Dactylosporangium sp. AC04546]|uniref:(2Fe-2S)-binding protein n=1 Tax=Dactylosporangium sp. AC04546 TaxID=2862460 RepID=UPI001EE08DAB|nr:(2Fe-2S)-binding protein [Dactylosporangium sp. AC04546]WVK81973.1 (2Fe-2S)-binding protein [Dactylosporangium sp. AC04546]